MDDEVRTLFKTPSWLAGMFMIAIGVAGIILGLPLGLPNVWGPRGGNIEVPIAIVDDFLVVLQPDSSLTFLDIETGAVLARGKSIADRIAPFSLREMIGSQNFVLLKGYFGKSAVFDRRTGEFVMELFANATATAPDGDRVFVLEWPFIVRCFDSANFALLWAQGVNLTSYSRLVLDGQVLCVVPEEDGEILRFSDAGEILPPVQSGTDLYEKIQAICEIEAAGRYKPGDLFQSAERMRKLFEKSEWPSSVEAVPENGLAAVFYDKNWSGGVFNREISTLCFADDATHWERRLAFSLKRRSGYSFAANKRFLIYSSEYGRIECVDRASGASVWIYGFPRRIWVEWNRPTRFSRFSILNWWEEDKKEGRRFLFQSAKEKDGFLWRYRAGVGINYYTSAKADYDRDLSRDELLGVRDFDAAEPARPPGNVDPNPVPFDTSGATTAAIVCWCAVLGLPLAFWYRRRGRNRRSVLLALTAVFVVNAAVFILFGRYSRAVFFFLGFEMIITYFFFALILMNLKPSASNDDAPGGLTER